mmetsp:Transcript_3225/g.7828  ORF Transcript_3225/g.7828 Transcript_3225/m.7828 type:complete len:135 (+) Transcript_3225:49-453(+)|eukprot:CAMPEP_0177628458 /NCGR_PEP_ID=MMETSP0447-20121125/143_1 /TAXON_ID=0 /ORGANISM="Stygamoeba regulata, Strain BSH-02190019" /LENGTH=134 /DNA_ID=CAMNT_0019129709 /DNA_START=44 /DNA_END=451 /DNA_ORIENTATION=-
MRQSLLLSVLLASALVLLLAVSVCSAEKLDSVTSVSDVLETNTHRSVIFSKSYCPHCRNTKTLFASNNYDHVLIELDQIPNGAAIHKELQDLTKQRTVPNVFVKNEHVGGNSDVQKLQKSGKLTKMIGDVKQEL